MLQSISFFFFFLRQKYSLGTTELTKRAPKKHMGARMSRVEEINDRRVGKGGSCGVVNMLLNFILKVRSDLCLERESLSKYFKI